jgi:hypothetical protein
MPGMAGIAEIFLVSFNFFDQQLPRKKAILFSVCRGLTFDIQSAWAVEQHDTNGRCRIGAEVCKSFLNICLVHTKLRHTLYELGSFWGITQECAHVQIIKLQGRVSRLAGKQDW